MRHVIFLWLLVAAALVGLSVPAMAHGGEDHDEAPAAPPPAATAQGWSAYAVSESYEMVVKSTPLLTGQPQDLKVLLSDFATNRPSENAGIELDFSGPADLTVKATPSAEKGIYLAHVAWPKPGTYQLVATVTGAGGDDLLNIDGLEVAAGGAGSGTGFSPVVGLGVAGALVGLGALVWWARARQRRRVMAGLVVATALSLSGLQAAQAHGGVDDGDEAPPAAQAPASGAVDLSKESQFLLGITTAPAKARSVAERAALLGRLVVPTQQVATLYAPQPGRIVSRRVADLGMRVKKGQVLAVVEQVLSTGEQIQVASDRIRLASEQAQLDTAIAQAERDVAKARADYGRLSRIRDLVAGKTLLDAQVTLGKAQDALDGLRAQRAKYQTFAPPSVSQARTFPVVSPIDGVVAEAHATFGETADPSKLLFQVVDPRTLWVEADVYERDIARISKSRQAVVSVDALPGERFNARLVSLGTMLDPQSRTLKARFAVDNPNGRLTPGGFARLAVAVGGADKVLSVLEGAVTEMGDRRVVFVHSAPERFVIRDVRVGEAEGGWVPVDSGLEEGERVVTQGVYELKSQAEKGGSR